MQNSFLSYLIFSKKKIMEVDDMDRRIYTNFEDYIDEVKHGQAVRGFFTNDVLQEPAGKVKKGEAEVDATRVIVMLKFTAVSKDRTTHYVHTNVIADAVVSSPEEFNKLITEATGKLDDAVKQMQKDYPSCKLYKGVIEVQT